MIRHLFHRFPRKLSKPADGHEGAGTSTSDSSGSSNPRPGHDANDQHGNTSSGSHSANDSPFVSRLNHVNKHSHVMNSEMNSDLDGIAWVSRYEALPDFKDVTDAEKQTLFIQKLALCCVVFEFKDPAKYTKEKEIKRQMLVELQDYVTSVSGKFPEKVIQESIKMVSANLFRTLTIPPHEHNVLESDDLDDDEPLMDPAWPHLQMVYEFLLRFVASPAMDAKLAKRYIDQSFVLRLLDLFDSEDPRERELLKTVTHRIYGKFMVHRPYMRKAINNIFYGFVFESEKHNGIAELLEILGSIINGFALPIKEEHKVFLVRALIPLHKPKSLPNYHQQLSYCITQFVEKDCKLADTVIRGLLKYWPLTNSMKEVMFIGELEEVLEATQPAEFQCFMVPLFQRIALCLSSPHFQVSERALLLWNNDHIVDLIKQNCKIILPIIFPGLEKNMRNHWNQAVLNLTSNVCKIFSDADRQLFEECSANFMEVESRMKEVESRREAAWKHLEDIAAQNSTSHRPITVS